MRLKLLMKKYIRRVLIALTVMLCLLAAARTTAWITGRTERFPEDRLPPVSSQSFGLLAGIQRYQGLTTDGEAWYFSWNLGLLKTDMGHKTRKRNFVAIPLKYLVKGSNHIGGISYWDGKLYIPLEDGPGYKRPLVLVYDAQTLRFTGAAYALPPELHLGGVSWVAADGPRGLAYTTEWNDAEVLNIFSLEDFSLVGTLPLSRAIDRSQDAEMYEGMLYCGLDNGGEKSVVAIDPETGEVTPLFDRSLGGKIEAEGLTVLPTEDGARIHCTEIGSSRVNVMFSHYALP